MRAWTNFLDRQSAILDLIDERNHRCCGAGRRRSGHGNSGVTSPMAVNDLLFQGFYDRSVCPCRALSRLLDIQTGRCRIIAALHQSSHHSTSLAASKLMDFESIVAEARKAKDGGETPIAGRSMAHPKPRDMDAIVEIVGRVRALGMETCMTLGMLDREQSVASARPGSITTITTSIPRSAIIRASPRRARSPTGSRRWKMSGNPA